MDLNIDPISLLIGEQEIKKEMQRHIEPNSSLPILRIAINKISKVQNSKIKPKMNKIKPKQTKLNPRKTLKNLT